MHEKDDSNGRPSIKIPLDLNKLLPYVVLGASCLLAWRGNSDATEFLKMQVQSEQASIQELTKQLSALSERLVRIESMSDRLSRVETKLDNYMSEQADQSDTGSRKR